MFDRILKRIRERVLARDYLMTLHAEEEMIDDGFTIIDVEYAIITGEITERQRDRKTKESKFIIQAKAMSRKDICLAVKFGPTGKLIIITVYSGE